MLRGKHEQRGEVVALGREKADQTPDIKEELWDFAGFTLMFR